MSPHPQPAWSEAAPDEANVCRLFARQAAATPKAPAVFCTQGDLSYGELARRAARVSAFLRARGLQPEEAVGVWMERRADLLAVLLGIWHAGGAYVPFDPQDPPARVLRMLHSSRTRRVLGDATLLAAATAAGGADAGFEGLDVQQALAAAQDDGLDGEAFERICAPGGARLAYLLFTSGSTGEPKAVEVEHRHAVALLRSACEMLRFTAADRCLAASTIAFDASITELYLPLVSGASLLMRDRKILLEPRRLAHDVRRHGITVLQTGPSVWAVALAELPDFPRVRIAITHGEAVAPEFARRLLAQGDEVWNLYGPTETTVWATGQCLSDPDALLPAPESSPMSAPIGRPLPHLRAYIVDEQGRLVADGEEGELWLAGPSVARGYRGHDALTQQRFVHIEGQRAYRSGDVVKRDARGVLHYFGRNDDQMKVRGVRVEPSEVEAAILRDERIVQAAATWFPTPAGTRAIVAALVLKPGAAATPSELHAQLKQHLPGPMIPARFLFVPWLPLTTSGKVDRKAIRAAVAASTEEAGAGAAQARAPAAGGSTQPTPHLSDTEEALAAMWRRALNVQTVQADDHFFSIGGDSLVAVQMTVELESRFGLQLPVHLIFEAPTLRGLAQRIDALRAQGEPEPDRGFVFPLVHRAPGQVPLFFSGVDLALARNGAWTVPCPLYAIANWAKGSGFVRSESMAALAASHLEHVRRIQPEGPYRLGGFSLGGLIALEMAQQLRAAGEAVELLFLLDPMEPMLAAVPASGASPAGRAGPSAAGAGPEARRHFGARLRRWAARIARGPAAIGWGAWLGTLLPIGRIPIVEWLGYLLLNYYGRNPSTAARALLPRNRWRAFWFAARRMVKGYTAQPYAGRTLAVFSESGRREAIWRALLAPNAESHLLDAGHHELFVEPTRALWMAWLARSLAARR